MTYFLSEELIVKSVTLFRKLGLERMGKLDTVHVTLEMPLEIWENVHKYLNVDIKGRPLGCGRHGCVNIVPEGMASNGPCRCKDPEHIANQLIWAQKNRKEKEK
jgi:hypothetical protein